MLVLNTNYLMVRILPGQLHILYYIFQFYVVIYVELIQRKTIWNNDRTINDRIIMKHNVTFDITGQVRNEVGRRQSWTTHFVTTPLYIYPYSMIFKKYTIWHKYSKTHNSCQLWTILFPQSWKKIKYITWFWHLLRNWLHELKIV